MDAGGSEMWLGEEVLSQPPPESSGRSAFPIGVNRPPVA